jgi:hypothetical protein
LNPSIGRSTRFHPAVILLEYCSEHLDKFVSALDPAQNGRRDGDPALGHHFGEISVWEVVAENQPFCPKELFPNTTNCYLDGVLERRR